MALADLALIHESPHGGCRSCRNSPGSWLSDTMLKLPFSDKRKGGGSRLHGCPLHLHLHFVCSHGPQQFTQGKRPASERRMQRGRTQWVVEPPQLPQPPPPPPSQQQQVSLCKIVELQAGPLWQGGSHVRHMTPPCANPPPSSWRQVDCAVRSSTLVFCCGGPGDQSICTSKTPTQNGQHNVQRTLRNHCLLNEHVSRKRQCPEAGALAPEHAVSRGGEVGGSFWH